MIRMFSCCDELFCETSCIYECLYNEAWDGKLSAMHSVRVRLSLLMYYSCSDYARYQMCEVMVKGIRMPIESYCMLYTTYKYSSMHISVYLADLLVHK
jgi:hypothetical protein